MGLLRSPALCLHNCLPRALQIPLAAGAETNLERATRPLTGGALISAPTTNSLKEFSST